MRSRRCRAKTRAPPFAASKCASASFEERIKSISRAVRARACMAEAPKSKARKAVALIHNILPRRYPVNRTKPDTYENIHLFIHERLIVDQMLGQNLCLDGAVVALNTAARIGATSGLNRGLLLVPCLSV